MRDEGHSIKDAMKSNSGTVSVPTAMANKVTTSRSIAAEQQTAAKKTSIHKSKWYSQTDSCHLVMKELGVILSTTMCILL